MKKPNYFVPVNFRETSYKALQYAMSIAKASGGSIFLFHVIDADKISDSGNPFTVRVSIEKLEQEARKKISSLCEILSITGIPGSQQIVFGNVKNEMQKSISSIQPDMIIMGKSKNGKLNTSVSCNINCPLIAVPESVNASVPNHVAFLNNSKPSNGKADILFDLVKQKQGKFSILNIGNGNGKHAEQLHNEFSDISHVSALSLNEINKTVNLHKIDLIFTKNPKRKFLSGIIGKNTAHELVKKSEVPVLLGR